MRKILILCILMVGGLINWVHATNNLDERPKKHLFVRGKDFQINDFQEISGIIRNNIEIVGKKSVKERVALIGIATDAKMAQHWLFLKKPKPY